MFGAVELSLFFPSGSLKRSARTSLHHHLLCVYKHIVWLYTEQRLCITYMSLPHVKMYVQRCVYRYTTYTRVPMYVYVCMVVLVRRPFGGSKLWR